MTQIINEAPPIIGSQVQRSLTRIGGLIPQGNGRFSGQPIIKLAWGQSEQCFDAGRMRTRFYDQKQQPVFKRTAYAITLEGQTVLRKYLERKEAALIDAFAEKDYPLYHTLLFLKHRHFLDNYIPTFQWKEVPTGLSVEQASLHVPAGWFYFEDIPEVLEIGSPNWFVLQWLPAEHIDSEENWNERRFNFQHVIEFGDDQKWIDSFGEYPKHGDYWNILLKVENSNGGYAYPGQRNCVSIIEEMWHAKIHRTAHQTVIANRVNDRLSANLAKTAKNDKIGREAFRNFAYEQGRVVVRGGTARVFAPEKYEKRKAKLIAKG